MSKRTLTLIIFMSLIPVILNAQWVKDKGKGYYKLSAWSLVSDQHYTDTGNIDPNVTRGYFNLNFYGEYGITDKWDIIAYIPFFRGPTRTIRSLVPREICYKREKALTA